MTRAPSSAGRPETTAAPSDPLRQLLVARVLDVLSDPRVVEALRAALATKAPVETQEGGLVDKRGLARALGISVATIDRLSREGMPFETVGMRRRYDVEACRTWCAGRGRRPTTPRAPSPEADTIDVSQFARRAGLRAVGGGR